MNEQCPALIDYITAPVNDHWTTTKNESLQNKDRLAVSVMVQNGEDVYIRSENYEIDYRGKANVLAKDLTTDALTSFDECSIDINPKKPECEISETVMNSATLCKDDIIFSEDFDEITDAGIEKYWKYDISLRVNGDGDEEFVMFVKSTRTAFVRNSILHIQPIARDEDIRRGTINLTDICTSKGDAIESECVIVADPARTFLPPIISAQLSTENSFHFKYGRVEIRAKLPKGDWIFPRLMLRPVHGDGPNIKVAFALGNAHLINGTDYANSKIGGNVLSGGLIMWPTSKNHDGLLVKTAVMNLTHHTNLEHYGNDFHTYTMTWTKSSLTFGVDDLTYGTINAQLNSEYYIVLGVSAGGHYEFPDNSRTGLTGSTLKPWNNLDYKAILKFWLDRNNWHRTWEGGEALQVDYVRVYAL